MDRFAQARNCSEEGCEQGAIGKFMGKAVCKDHLTAYMDRASQEIPVAEQGIQQSQGPERIKYERFKQVLRGQIDEGEDSLTIDSINNQLQLMQKGSSVVASRFDEAYESDERSRDEQEEMSEEREENLTCSYCGKMKVEQSHIDRCAQKKAAQVEPEHVGRARMSQGTPRCYICHAPVARQDAVQVTVNGRPALRHKNPAVCEQVEDALYAEPDSVLDDVDALSIVSKKVICAMCGDDWNPEVLDHNKIASLVEGNGCPTCDGAPLCMGCSHKFVAHSKGVCGAEEIRFDRRLAMDVRDTCSCSGYMPLDISYYDEHLASKIAAGYPPRADDDLAMRAFDHPEDDEDGNDDFPNQDILEGVAHEQEHKRQYIPVRSSVRSDVPFVFITDHLGELATGVEPATCKFCGERMEAHAQWAPTKQSSKNTSKWKGVFNFLASFGRGDVPETFITDHLGELATGIEPATCKVCGEAISRHAQWLPTKQAAPWKPETNQRQASSDSFEPPAEVAKNAERGLDLRKEHGRGGTEIGVARARDLSNRKGLSYDTVKRMKAYFDRHEVDKEGEGWGKDSAGYIAWLLWGGDAGRSWANKIVKEKEGDKKEARTASSKPAGYRLVGHSGNTRLVANDECGFCGGQHD